MRLEVDDERFKALWVAKTPLLQIAALFGGTKSWVSLHARRLGLEPRQTSTGQLPGAAIAAAYEQGHSLRAIRKALLPKWPKISERTIAAALRARGVALRPRRVSPHKLDVPAIIRLARAGYSDGRIAKHYKVGRQVIQRIVHSILGHRPKGSRSKVDVKRLLGLIKSGKTYKETAAALGCTTGAVNHHLKRLRVSGDA